MNLTAALMLQAFDELDHLLTKPVRLIVGGGGAMLLAHHFSLSTSDVDAVPTGGVTMQELDPLIKQVATKLKIAPDWLNPYYSSFAHVLPRDYGDRLVEICQLRRLSVQALSKEDLLIMKCFAARLKDVPHARALIKKGAQLSVVEAQIDLLIKKRIPGSEKARKFLDELKAFFADREE